MQQPQQPSNNLLEQGLHKEAVQDGGGLDFDSFWIAEDNFGASELEDINNEAGEGCEIGGLGADGINDGVGEGSDIDGNINNVAAAGMGSPGNRVDGLAEGPGYAVNGVDGVQKCVSKKTYPCWDKECGLVFDSVMKRGNHHRDVHQGSLVCTVNSGVSVTVLRNEDSKFHCPIIGCKFTNNSPRNFRRHVKGHPAGSELKEGFTGNDKVVGPPRFEKLVGEVDALMADQYREKCDKELPQISQVANVRSLVERLGDSREAACAMLKPELGPQGVGCYLEELADAFMLRMQSQIKGTPIESRKRVVNGSSSCSSKARILRSVEEDTCKGYSKIVGRFLLFIVGFFDEFAFSGIEDPRKSGPFQDATKVLFSQPGFAKFRNNCIALLSARPVAPPGGTEVLTIKQLLERNDETTCKNLERMEEVLAEIFSCQVSITVAYSSVTSLFIFLYSVVPVGLCVVQAGAKKAIAALQYIAHCVILSGLVKDNCEDRPGVMQRGRQSFQYLERFHGEGPGRVMDYVTCYKELAHLAGLYSVVQSGGLERIDLTWLGASGSWNDINIGGKRLSISEASAVIRWLKSEARKLLCVQLLGLSESCRSWQDIMGSGGSLDDVLEIQGDRRNGYSFMDVLPEPWRKLKSRVGAERVGVLFKEDGSLKGSQADSYEVAARDFLEIISVLKDFAAGQPGRKSESPYITIKNEHDKERNIKLHNGYVMYMPLYNKTDNMLGRHKGIYRFFDKEVSRMLVLYVFIVVDTLAIIHSGRGNPGGATFLQELGTIKNVLFQYRGKVLAVSRFYAVFKTWFNKALDAVTPADTCRPRFYVSEIRHWMVAIAMKNHVGFQFLNRDSIADEDDEAETSEGDGPVWVRAQAASSGHTVHTRVSAYGLSSDRDPSAKSGATWLSLQNQFVAAVAWHSLLGIPGQPAASPAVIPQVLNPVIQSPAGPSVAEPVAQGLLGSSNDDYHGVIASQASQVSRATRRSQHLGRKQARMFEAEICLQLQQFMGVGSSFKSAEQGEAVHALLQHDKDCLVVLPTAGGKTVVYTLPAYVENDRYLGLAGPTKSVTVLVLPLVVLEADQYVRILGTKKLNVQVWKYDGLQQDENYTAFMEGGNRNIADIVITSIETAVSEIFRRWLTGLAMLGLLRRIVIDEAHLVADSCYRISMMQVSLIRQKWVGLPPVRVCAFTATCPPMKVPILLSWLGLSPTHTMIVRTPRTDRVNLKYISKKENTEAEALSEVKRMVYDVQARHKDTGEKTIIFCSTRNDVDIVGKSLEGELSVEKYTGAMSKDEKKASWQRFISKEGPTVMIATIAGGLGADFASIRRVIIFGGCSGWEWFSQMAGRGGRDGLGCEVVFVWSDVQLCTYKRNFHLGSGGSEGELGDFMDFTEIMRGAVDGEVCIRQELVWAIDGVEVPSCNGNTKDYAACSMCEKAREECELKPCTRNLYSRPLVQQNPELILANKILEDVMQTLQRARSGSNPEVRPCPPCYVNDSESEAWLHVGKPGTCKAVVGRCMGCLDLGHKARDCPHKKRMPEQRGVCYYCHLPLDWAGVTTHSGSLDKEGCNSGGMDFIIPTCFAVEGRKDIIRRRVFEKFGLEGDINREKFSQWLVSFKVEAIPLLNSVRMFHAIGEFVNQARKIYRETILQPKRTFDDMMQNNG